MKYRLKQVLIFKKEVLRDYWVIVQIVNDMVKITDSMHIIKKWYTIEEMEEKEPVHVANELFHIGPIYFHKQINNKESL
jgi:hypothetical protein